MSLTVIIQRQSVGGLSLGGGGGAKQMRVYFLWILELGRQTWIVRPWPCLWAGCSVLSTGERRGEEELAEDKHMT